MVDNRMMEHVEFKRGIIVTLKGAISIKFGTDGFEYLLEDGLSHLITAQLVAN